MSLFSSLLADTTNSQIQLNLLEQAEKQGLSSFQTENAFGSLISSVLQALMPIAFLLVLFYLVSGAIDWITSSGDKGKLETARQKMTNALIGVVVLASSVAIFMLFQNFLGLQFIQNIKEGDNQEFSKPNWYIEDGNRFPTDRFEGVKGPGGGGGTEPKGPGGSNSND